MAGIQENDKTYYSLDEKEREWEDTVDKRIGTLIDNIGTTKDIRNYRKSGLRRRGVQALEHLTRKVWSNQQKFQHGHRTWVWKLL